MKPKKQRPRPGDVLEVRLPDGFAYLHYLGRHQVYGDAILVGTRQLLRANPVTADTLAGGYVTFYPAKSAAAQGLVTIVCALPAPPVPTRLRRPTFGSTWVIEDADGETVMPSLPEDELVTPIAQLWNHAYLIEMIATGYRPEQDLGATEPPPHAKPGAVSHYLYIPARTDAEDVAAHARQLGYRAMVQPGPDDTNWLVLVAHDLDETGASVDRATDALEPLALAVGGKYDGHEIQLDAPET